MKLNPKRPNTLVAIVLEFIYTGFYSGFSPVAPGTAGTIAAWLLYLLFHKYITSNAVIIHGIITIVLLFPAFLLGDVAEKHIGTKDPQIVVFDEIMGYWISVIFLPYSIKTSLIALILFRIFDITKIGPIKKLQKLKGGVGIMIDDYAAGLLTNAIIWGLFFIQKQTGFILV
jgi:phosphatidylglycerophosphatase A